MYILCLNFCGYVCCAVQKVLDFGIRGLLHIACAYAHTHSAQPHARCLHTCLHWTRWRSTKLPTSLPGVDCSSWRQYIWWTSTLITFTKEKGALACCMGRAIPGLLLLYIGLCRHEEESTNPRSAYSPGMCGISLSSGMYIVSSPQ